ncbi:cobalt-precorrin-6A/precorrin-6x reductase [Sulfitobacter sp. M57]|uniref:precorrin-6A/cobalt-precorrin-6A reductase n=1 Tax=unclassified Sulfitobacter TaxID=196795 RepID=UPI0023E23900|nr:MULTISPECIES: precorrin-6A/cobalt-precorrin-6A reductase [unclassified Sulfitobacter]MDF3413938.1 cobalt-precorrin-6A/precorrin-6x reductase [Sulfitobacter sp. KE5]MDF3420781.1 cobalt-precorrin-6A/precorrin-6x reductase [Sulfitobacter sp. KE43]MDF3432484.1 cobalt-precorrin-6A/precorrin-6x reductase [Sulfitobacter sp. KE42]MDF3458123.1 cobalt-precorrin-6A/precorrin-6x reductase [Sulfitobacter sp. S74]MDF3462024.1 cobalt-precorrin-6A/precorrin-6x reductase [Sulfitobacter sp. Ks18]
MEHAGHILLLAGSAEARRIAVALLGQGWQVLALMSEPPRGADPMPVPFEICPDVTQAQIERAAQGAYAVIDASHGFDGHMTQMGHAAARVCGLPILTLSRPAWSCDEDDLWQTAPDVASAMPMIGPADRVFSATGWASLPEYKGFQGACLMLRQTAAHQRPVPFDFVELVFGTAPFSVVDEIALFKARRVDVLMARNLGGLPSRPKLEAAKALRLRVILIDRPVLPAGIRVVKSVDDVLVWLARL